MAGAEAGFFDCDGTLYRDHLVVAWLKELIRWEHLPQEVFHGAREHFWRHRSREGSFNAYAEHVIRILVDGHIAIPVDASVDAGKRVAKRHGKRVNVFTRELCGAVIESKKFAGAISGSPLDVVRPFAEFHFMSDALGTTFHRDGDRYVGTVDHDWVKAGGKGRAVERFANAHGLDLKESFAIGDTTGDIPMLEKVGYPICFNPDDAFRREAEKRHWPIVVERKNSVYVLTWFGHTQKYQLCETPNPIIPHWLRERFLPRFQAHFS